jgi:hypothetical protein
MLEGMTHPFLTPTKRVSVFPFSLSFWGVLNVVHVAHVLQAK